MYFYQPQHYAVPLDLVLDFDAKLFIGCLLGLNQYQNYGINAIISLCSEQRLAVGDEVDHLVLDVHDRPQTDISKYFKQTNKFIDKHIDKKNNILVHCAAGKSRSATIVLAYLMYSQKWTLQEALIYLKSVRPMVNPNPGFVKQLLQYEEKLFGKVRSSLSHQHTPYFSVQNPDTVLPQYPVRNNCHYQSEQKLPMQGRRQSFASPSHFCSPQRAPYVTEFPYTFTGRFVY